MTEISRNEIIWLIGTHADSIAQSTKPGQPNSLHMKEYSRDFDETVKNGLVSAERIAELLGMLAKR